MQSRPFVLPAMVFICACWAGQHLLHDWVLLVIIGSCSFMYAIVCRNCFHEQSRIKVILVLGLFLALGMLAGNQSSTTHGDEYAFPLGINAYQFQIVNIPKHIRNQSQTRSIMIGKLLEQQPQSSAPLIQLNVPGKHWVFGQHIAVWGTIHSRKNYYNCGIQRPLMPVHGIWAKQAMVIHNSNSLFSILGHIRWKCAALLEKTLPPEQAAVLSAMLLGSKEGIGHKLRIVLQKSGISHLLAVSGLHIGFFVSMVFFMVRYGSIFIVGAKYRNANVVAALTCLALIPVYIVFTGAAWSTIRAGIMVSAAMTALLVKRQSSLSNILACTALLLVSVEPDAITNVGFLLSFSAVMAILLCLQITTFIDRGNGFTFVKAAFRLFAISVCIGVVHLPLVASHFHFYNIASCVFNVFAIPLAGLIVGIGAIGLLLTTVCEILGAALLQFVGHMISLLLWGAEIFSQAELFQVQLGQMPIVIAVLYYACIGLGFWLYPKWKSAIVCWSLGLALLIFTQIGLPRSNKLELHLIDVGQSESMLLTLPDGKNVLIDSSGIGSNSNWNSGEKLVIPYLLNNQVRQLDALIITHPHPDHIGGAEAVISSMEVGEIVYNGEEKVPLQASLLQLADSLNIDTHAPQAGEVLFQDDLYSLQVLQTSSETITLGENDRSLVLLLSYGVHKILLVGDLEQSGEATLLEAYPQLQVDVLKIGHHGSDTSSSLNFITQLQPKHALISCGRGNKYGFPRETVMDNLQEVGAQIWSTDVMGAITVTVLPHELIIKTCH